MSIVCLGLNHRTAPITVRERYALADSQLPELLGKLIAETSAQEAVILSTCNRVEIYAVGSGLPQHLLNELRVFLIGPEEAEHLARPHGHADVDQGGHVRPIAEPGPGIGLGYVVDGEGDGQDCGIGREWWGSRDLNPEGP